MKIITPYLLRFGIAASILTILFRYALSNLLAEGLPLLVFVVAVIYGTAMFFSGRFYGKKDIEYLPIADIGFRFHLTTYLIYNLVSWLWFVADFHSSSENIQAVHYTALVWGVFLIIHLGFYIYSRKRTINHLDKDELFD